MIRYIKAFIKTLRQINDRAERYMHYGFTLMLLGAILLFIADLFIKILAPISALFLLSGLYFICSAFWEDSKDDFYKFIEKVKKNI